MNHSHVIMDCYVPSFWLPYYLSLNILVVKHLSFIYYGDIFQPHDNNKTAEQLCDNWAKS